MAKDIDVLLEQQADQMTAVLKTMRRILKACWRSIAFRSRSWHCTTAQNRSFVRYSTTCVITLVQVTINEAGLADAEDARYLLRILDRMELSALEGKPL